MELYYGTAAQQNQQRKSDRLTSWVFDTPGACLTGQLMCSDDPDRLGWDVVERHLAEDRLYAFRWMDAEGQKQVEEFAAEQGGNTFGWAGFYAGDSELRRFIAPIIGRHLPHGMRMERITPQTVCGMQAMLGRQGMVSLSGAVLCGLNCRALSLMIRDWAGRPAALGFTGMLQNRFSRLGDCAWIGTIATDPAHRGKGLGKRITAALIRAALEEFNARAVMGFAADGNAASKAMLHSCGLQPHPNRSLVVSLSKERYTR